jgi:TonB family protein
MNMPIPFGRCAAVLVVSAFVGAATLRAQNALYVEDNGKGHLVRRVLGHMPMYEDTNGKFVEVVQPRFMLKPVAEYSPAFVSIRHVQVVTHVLENMSTGDELNHSFEFRGEFESSFPLENVFVALDLNTSDEGKILFIREIGRLKPRDPKAIVINVPMATSIGEGHYKLHLFSDGVEVLQSQMPLPYVEQSLDKMVKKRVAGIKDAAPSPFVGPPPEYPEKLFKANVSGRAVIHFTLSPNGRVVDPVLKSATDPAFGESALAAARMWRFLPKIKDGAAVPVQVDLPFNFSPPSTTAPTAK